MHVLPTGCLLQITTWSFLFSVADNLDLPCADTIFKEGPGGGVELVEKTVVSKAELLNMLKIARSVTDTFLHSRSQSVRGRARTFRVGGRSIVPEPDILGFGQFLSFHCVLVEPSTQSSPAESGPLSRR